MAVGFEVSSNVWLAAIAMKPSRILLEVNAVPFEPNQPKDLAPWASEENLAAVRDYLDRKVELIAKLFQK